MWRVTQGDIGHMEVTQGDRHEMVMLATKLGHWFRLV